MPNLTKILDSFFRPVTALINFFPNIDSTDKVGLPKQFLHIS